MTSEARNFIIAYCRRAPVTHVAAVVDQPPHAIAKLRNRGVCRQVKRRTFAELFPLYHGRLPREEEWPAPRTAGSGGYEWLAPELTLLASLTGRVGTDEICQTLTARLRRLTGNPTVERNRNAVHTAQQRIGLQTADVVGGITANQAGRAIGCTSIIYNEIRRGHLRAGRVGRHLVIPHDEFARWKATRVFPPAGFVSLSTLKRPLGITSDKLSEWARLGYVPTAVRCNPYGTRAPSTKFGTWYIDRKVQTKLIADRRAGRPMPWWKQPEPYNLKATWRLWQRRQHPSACPTCRTIWGPAGPPATFDAYVERYPPLAHGAKRHLTRPWCEGLSVQEVARQVNLLPSAVTYAIRSGVLRATRQAGRYVITRTDATRWKARHCPTGAGLRSWVQIATACRFYGFTRAELLGYVQAGRLRSTVGTFGAQRGVRYVLKQQVRELRETEGFLETDAARRLGISVARLRTLARYTDWRATDRYTADVLNTIRKRLASAAGVPIAEAARRLRRSVAWVEREIAHGTARVLRTPFQTRRRYISEPMFQRLVAAVKHPTTHQRWTAEWLLVSDAALLAGVCTTTIQRWSNDGDVATRKKGRFRRYHRRSVMKRARLYWPWAITRYKRAVLPAWLQAERTRAA